MGKYTGFDRPPPGRGFDTTTVAVPGTATSDAGTLTWSSESLMKMVANGLPFHSTTETELKPVPFTVSVNCALPGATLSGTRG